MIVRRHRRALRRRTQIPRLYGSIVRAGEPHVVARQTRATATNVVGVRVDCGERLLGREVPQSHRFVVRHRDDVCVVGGETRDANRAGVAAKATQHRA